MEKQCLKVDIIKKDYEKDYKYDNTVILTVNISNFTVNSQQKLTEFLINNALKQQRANFMQNATNNLYPQAVEDYNYRKENNFPFNEYVAYLVYTVTFNSNCLLSFYYDNYTYTGGAHGNTLRLANTFSLLSGFNVPLSAFFKSDTDYIKKLTQIIIKQADQNQASNPGIYFDNYRELIVQFFNKNSFYLTKDGLVIYYGQYDIAPYSSGIIEFTIPYSELDYPPTCENWC